MIQRHLPHNYIYNVVHTYITDVELASVNIIIYNRINGVNQCQCAVGHVIYNSVKPGCPPTCQSELNCLPLLSEGSKHH